MKEEEKMFLAYKEIMHSKARYLLITGLLFLIAYLVFFLTGLSYGLAQDNRLAVDAWSADQIVLASDSNHILGKSNFEADLANEITADQKALFSEMPGVVKLNEEGEKINVALFGIQGDEFLKPDIVAGKMFDAPGQGVVDISMKNQYGLEIGDSLQVANMDHPIIVVGFTKNQRFSVAPVVFTSLEDLKEIRYSGLGQLPEKDFINAVVVRGQANHVPEELETISIEDFIQDIPGYRAQVVTFNFMIGFLIVIAAVVVGIFIYVLTMQKAPIFGVMKAQGIATSYIAKSVLGQSFLLASLGVVFALLATLASAYLLPAAVPFALTWEYFLLVGILIIIAAVMAALFSVRAIAKGDPLEAMA